MIEKKTKSRKKTNKFSRRFRTHHGSAMLPLRHSDVCYRLQQRLTNLKRQSQGIKSRRRMRSKMKIQITLKEE